LADIVADRIQGRPGLGPTGIFVSVPIPTKNPAAEVGTSPKSNIHVLEMWVLAGFLFPWIEFCVSLGRRLSPSGGALEVPNSPSGNAKPNLGQQNHSKTHILLGTTSCYFIRKLLNLLVRKRME
jgi:hypothetical protein